MTNELIKRFEEKVEQEIKAIPPTQEVRNGYPLPFSWSLMERRMMKYYAISSYMY